MKKLLIITNILTLIFLYFQSFTPPSPTPCCPDKNYSMELETPQYFSDVVARYRTSHYNIDNIYRNGEMVNNRPEKTMQNFNDARTCWFSLERLKKFICMIETNTTGKLPASSKLGIRFYYAAYPDTISTEKYKFHHTLFLTPTFSQGNINQDYEPRLSTKNNIVLLKSLMNTSSPFFKKPAMILGDNKIMNQGELCPPGTGCIDVLDNIDNIYPDPHE